MTVPESATSGAFCGHLRVSSMPRLPLSSTMFHELYAVGPFLIAPLM